MTMASDKYAAMSNAVRLELMREAIIKAARQWEERNASVPENPMLRAFAARYGVSYDWLMGRKATPEVER